MTLLTYGVSPLAATRQCQVTAEVQRNVSDCISQLLKDGTILSPELLVESIQNYLAALKEVGTVTFSPPTVATCWTVCPVWPSFRGIPKHKKIYVSRCLDTSGKSHVRMLKGVSKRKAKVWMRQQDLDWQGRHWVDLAFVPQPSETSITLSVLIFDKETTL